MNSNESSEPSAQLSVHQWPWIEFQLIMLSVPVNSAQLERGRNHWLTLFFFLSFFSPWLPSCLYLQARQTGPLGSVYTSEDRQPTKDWRPRRGYCLSRMTQRKGGPPDSKWREDGCQWLQLSALMLPTHWGKCTGTADFHRYVFHRRLAVCKFSHSLRNDAKDEVHPNGTVCSRYRWHGRV